MSANGAKEHLQFVGHYELLTQLATGSTADIYLAKRYSGRDIESYAVVKYVRKTRPGYRELVSMLLDEARATSLLEHPNIVRFLDYGEDEHGVFLALEYVDGTDLKILNQELLARKEALPFELAGMISVGVLRGLTYAHNARDKDGAAMGLIHRDISPSNVLISRTGHVKLADFGVVQMHQRLQQKTEPGLIKGKYAYLAPEYIAGESTSIQTDIYAVGILLFELLTGRECFTGGTSYEVMWKVINKGVPLHRLAREEVPDNLAKIVERATSPVPEARYRQAEEMANALEAWAISENRHATPWILSAFISRHQLIKTPAQSPVDNVLDTPEEEEKDRPKLKKAVLRADSDNVTSESPQQDSRGLISESTPPEGFAPPPEFPPDFTQAKTMATIPTSGTARATNVFPSVPPSRPHSNIESSDLPSESLPGDENRELASRDKEWKGTLDNVSPIKVLDQLLEKKATGVVEFHCGLIWKRVDLWEGQPVAISSNMGMELIGEHLVKAKVVDRRDLDQALRTSEQEQTPLTRTLINRNLLTKDDLERELGKNLGTRLNDALEWRWGTFAFVPGKIELPELKPKLDLKTLLASAAAVLAAEEQSLQVEKSLEEPAEVREALKNAESIRKGGGKGRIERPWRPK